MEQEIESFLRRSHAEHFSYLENKFSISLRQDLPIWPDFIELTERRNLIAHADGIVSRQYLTVCKAHGADVAGREIGQELEVSNEYFDRSYEVLFEIGYKLGQVLWRKVFSDESEQADEALIADTLDLIKEGRYALAAKLLHDFLFNIPYKDRRLGSRIVMVINLAQSKKWLGQEDDCEKTLACLDDSGIGLQYKLAIKVLRDDFVEALPLLRACVGSNLTSKDDLRDWPLFKEFRKRDDFRVTYKSLFREEFSDVHPLLARIERAIESRKEREQLQESVSRESSKIG